jgi:hypothetical protein
LPLLAELLERCDTRLATFIPVLADDLALESGNLRRYVRSSLNLRRHALNVI